VGGGFRSPEVLDGADLAALSEEARRRPRLRANRNVHDMADPVHRLLNAMEPGTYVRPHRHLAAPRDETVVVVAGAVGLLVFDGEGALAAATVLRPAPGRFLADVKAGEWHSFVSLEPGTVFFEVKAGPYVAPPSGDLAPWAPPEGDPRAGVQESEWRDFLKNPHANFTGKGENPVVAI
jgi:cupin fold WbuC family metalloprotein